MKVKKNDMEKSLKAKTEAYNKKWCITNNVLPVT